jgi:sulfur carrier protein
MHSIPLDGYLNDYNEGRKCMSNVAPENRECQKTEWIDLVVNGEPVSAPAGITLAALVDRMNLPRDRVAVEVDRRIIRRPAWEETPLQPGSRVEIVHFVGGG